MISEKRYYVYILFKTYKEGIFKYQDLEFDMEPFYVGKGTKNRIACSKSDTNSSNKHKSRILEKIIRFGLTVTAKKYKENLTEDESLIIEQELINKIGRKDLGNGPLSNLTNGGDGTPGATEKKNKSVLKYSIEGEFIKEYKSLKIASIENSIHASNISHCCLGKRETAGNYVWRFKNSESKEKINTNHLIDRKQKGNERVKVLQYDLNGNFIRKYNSIKEASASTKAHTSKIVLVCQGKRKHTKGFKFEYEKY